MKEVKFNGLDEILELGSYIELKVDDENMFNTILRYCDSNKTKTIKKISIKGKSLAESLALAEKSLTKQYLSLQNKEFLKTLNGIEWLLKNNFDIFISKEHYDYFNIQVSAEDQYKGLINGLYNYNTCSSNGISTLFQNCNGWANTLKKHIEKNNEFIKNNYFKY